jgi:hypothetical protein
MGDTKSPFPLNSPLSCSGRRSGAQGSLGGLGFRSKPLLRAIRGAGGEILILRLCSSSRGLLKFRSLEGVNSRVAIRPGEDTCGATLRKAEGLAWRLKRGTLKRIGGKAVKGDRLLSVSLGE